MFTIYLNIRFILLGTSNKYEKHKKGSSSLFSKVHMHYAYALLFREKTLVILIKKMSN